MPTFMTQTYLSHYHPSTFCIWQKSRCIKNTEANTGLAQHHVGKHAKRSEKGEITWALVVRRSAGGDENIIEFL